MKKIVDIINEEVSNFIDFDVNSYQDFWNSVCGEAEYGYSCDWEGEGREVIQANIDTVKEYKYPLTVYRGVWLNEPKYVQKKGESWSFDIEQAKSFGRERTGTETFYMLRGEIDSPENLNVRKAVQLLITNNAEDEIRPNFVSNIKFIQ